MQQSWNNDWVKGKDYPSWGDTDVYKKTISGGYLINGESPRDAYQRVARTVARRLYKPELEKRGFEVAIFHATGMGGMAFENIASNKGFCCVMDFALPEIGNLMVGSVVNAGKDRMLNAGRMDIPQIVAPGCLDLIDFAGWQKIPDQTL